MNGILWVIIIKGGGKMRVVIDDEKFVVEVWLMKGEKDNFLKDIIQEYKPKKYTIAVFRSGIHDLAKNTSALLVNNL